MCVHERSKQNTVNKHIFLALVSSCSVMYIQCCVHSNGLSCVTSVPFSVTAKHTRNLTYYYCEIIDESKGEERFERADNIQTQLRH